MSPIIGYSRVEAATFGSEKVIDHDETWTAAQGPYYINGDVRILFPATLTIEPGTEINVQSGGFSIWGKVQIGSLDQLTPIRRETTSPTFTVMGGTLSLDNVQVSGGEKLIDAFMQSSVAISASTFEQVNSGSSYISVFGSSTVAISDSRFEHIKTRVGVEAFQGSQLSIIDSEFNDVSSQTLFSIFGVLEGGDKHPTQSIIQRVQLRNGGGTAIEISDRAQVNLSQNLIDSFAKAGLAAYSSSSVSMSSSTIKNTNIGIEAYRAYVDINGNNIELSKDGITSFGSVFAAKNNWWGDPTGPYNASTHPLGKGVSITPEVQFSPWSAERIPDTDGKTCCSNVLFIPGIEASRLYKKDTFFENQLWEPNRNADVQKLSLDIFGKSINPLIYTRDIILKTSLLGGLISQSVYKEFTDSLNSLVSQSVIKEWKPLPYDWRLNMSDIVDTGIRMQKSSILLPMEVVQALASSSDTHKVTIVAHSNGGLFTKVLMNKLRAAHLDSLVDKIIFVAVPEHGTPEAMAALLHGDGQSFLGGIVLSKKTARDLADDMIPAYNLLPSPTYFDKSVDPEVVRYSSSKSTMEYPYGASIHDVLGMYNFLVSSKGERTLKKSDTKDTDWPNILSSSLIDLAKQFHQTYDNWSPSFRTKIFTIAGMGKDTVKGIEYFISDCNTGSFIGDILIKSKCGYTKPRRLPIISKNGDGVVMGGGIHMRPSNSYFIDLYGLNQSLQKNFGHRDIMNTTPVIQMIASIIQNKAIPSNSYILPVNSSSQLGSTIGASAPTYTYTVDSSAATIAVRDNDKATGYIPPTSLREFEQIKEDIPNSSYFDVGTIKKITIADKPAPEVKIQGNAVGTFTFTTEKQAGGVSYGLSFFEVPITPVTTATLDTTGPTTTLQLDVDSDGHPDTVIYPAASSTASSTMTWTDFDALFIRLRAVLASTTLATSIKQKYLDRFDGIEIAYRAQKQKETAQIVTTIVDRIVNVMNDIDIYKTKNPTYDSDRLIYIQYAFIYTIFIELQNTLQKFTY